MHCRTYVPSEGKPSVPRMNPQEATRPRHERRSRRLARLLSGVDLAIDLATLGEYGLEPLPAEAPCRTRRPTLTSAWEALPAPRGRRGECGRPARAYGAGLSRLS